MKSTIITILFTSLIFTGCGSKKPKPQPKQHYEKPTAKKEARFKTSMIKVAHSTMDNHNYNKMTLDTPEKKAWFKTLMYRLWDRQITRKQFITEGLIKYPKHRYEFRYIANGFQRF